MNRLPPSSICLTPHDPPQFTQIEIAAREDADETGQVIEIPVREDREDGSNNVIGELLNAEGVPLCVDERKFNHHIMVAGGSGSGKSNVSANLTEQAVKYGKCVLVHDAKPDYGKIKQENTDPRVRAVWERLEDYRLFPHGAGLTHDNC